MQCPSCRAEIQDDDALYCSRCGAPLSTETEATNRTTPVPPPAPDPGPAANSAAQTAPVRRSPQMTLLHDFSVALKSSFMSGGWPQVAGAAAIAFLALLGIGAFIVAALAIGGAGFGPGIDALDVLALVVMFGLSTMGVSLEVGLSDEFGIQSDAAFSMVWLGALIVVGSVIVWATGRVVAGRRPATARSAALEGAKVALPFALYALLAALFFKLSRPAGTFGASATGALWIALFWGLLFGAIGGLGAGGSVWGRGLDVAKKRRRSLYDGLSAAGVMLAATALMAAAAFLVMVIVALARDESLEDLSVAGVIATLMLLIVLLPNVLSLIAAVALGAPLAVDGFGGRDVSIIGFGGETWGAPALLLLLIPLLACLLGGFSAYGQSMDRTHMVAILGWAAAAYASTLAILARLNEVSFEASPSLLGISGRFAAGFFAVLFLGALWAAVFGFAGWKLAELQDPDRHEQESQSIPGPNG